MKKIFSLAVGVTCLVANLGAQADSGGNANLKVIGTIKPAACTVTLGTTGGTVDYGLIAASTLQPTTPTPLTEKSLPLNVNCGSTAAQIALSVNDLQASSTVDRILGAGIPETQNFGLGTVGNRRTGGYSVRFSSLNGAGATLHSIKRATQASSWMYSSDGRIDKFPYQHSWSRNTQPVPAFVTSVSGTLVVRAVINRGDALDLGNDIPLNGLATLVVNRI